MQRSFGHVTLRSITEDRGNEKKKENDVAVILEQAQLHRTSVFLFFVPSNEVTVEDNTGASRGDQRLF